MKDDMELFKRLAQCQDKEEMARCIDDFNAGKKTVTKADHIRSMSDEELAAFLLRFFVENMDANDIPHEKTTEADKMALLRLLQQPVEVSECSK